MKKLLGLMLVLMTSTAALAQTAPAPAPAAPVTPPNAEWLGMYQGPGAETLTDLEKAHRSVREISDWASETIAECLQFSPGKVTEKLTSVRPYFSDAGYKAYLAFLGSQPFAAGLRDQSLKLVTIVNDAPLLIGQGASGGRYAWAFEMPVIMTPDGQQTTVTPVTLRVQIGRNADAPGPNGVLIENWQIYQENVQNPPADAQQP